MRTYLGVDILATLSKPRPVDGSMWLKENHPSNHLLSLTCRTTSRKPTNTKYCMGRRKRG